MTLERTQRRRQAIGTIHDLVGAMRAIAAGRIQSAQRAAASSHRYEAVVLRGIAALTTDLDCLAPRRRGRPTLLMVMTSEQPLCGSFNQDVISLADRRLRELREQGPVRLLVIGRRGAGRMATHGVALDAAEAAATSVHGLRDVVKRLAAGVDRWIAAGELGTLRAVYNRYQSISQQVPTEEQILPIDWAKIRESVPASSRAILSPALRSAPLGRADRRVRLHPSLSDRGGFVRQRAGQSLDRDGRGHAQYRENAAIDRRPRTARAARRDHAPTPRSHCRPICGRIAGAAPHKRSRLAHRRSAVQGGQAQSSASRPTGNPGRSEPQDEPDPGL